MNAAASHRTSISTSNAAAGDVIEAAITAHDAVASLVRLTVIEQAPGDLLVAAKLALVGDPMLGEIIEVLTDVELSIRAAEADARTIYLEPVRYRTPAEIAPPTDTFVIKSAD